MQPPPPPPDHESPTSSIQSLPTAASALRLLPHQRPSSLDSAGHGQKPPGRSEAALPPPRDRRSNPSAASLFASTLTPPGSRSASPAPARPFSPGRSVFGAGSPTVPQQSLSLLDAGAAENPGDPLSLVLKSFVPHVAVVGSADVEELIRAKGFEGGLWELLRPFGERLQGKVTVRDSNGGARPWDDFSIRFTRFGDGIETAADLSSPAPAPAPSSEGLDPAFATAQRGGLADRQVARVELVVNRHLNFAEEAYMHAPTPATATTRQGPDPEATSPYYSLYLRRLLSGMPLSAHETFAHPVASVIAISSRNPAPIEALRKLYAETSQGDGGLPVWVDGEYLRYYVLVHDEENGDVSKSMALFDQMKRNFGLHCHLLRIRSSQSAETDDDSIPLPRSDWMTASEELADIEKSEENEDFADPRRYIYESDATAIRTLVREMVTQSIVPNMERNVSLWNDQVASRRRGISGRFMSLSKRFAFGSGNRNGASGGGGAGAGGGAGSGSSNHYDAKGFYRPETPEAIMRKLGDFAFMLRDWKLAMSTYELLRGDFQNDKAWRHHAAANEMAALALLIMPQNMSSKTRIESINPMLEQAFYSYHTRCSSPYGATRCIMLALELLRLRGGSGIDEAVKWGIRLLDSRILGPVGDALLHERLAIGYATKCGVGSQAWGSRWRKSALWSVLGAEAWFAQSKSVQAQRCLHEAERAYARLRCGHGVTKFAGAHSFVTGLQRHVQASLAGHEPARDGGCAYDAADGAADEAGADEEREDLQTEEEPRRARGASFASPASSAGVGGAAAAAAGAAAAARETGPLTPLTPARLTTLAEEGGGSAAAAAAAASGDGFG
ncbi:hypothetical protein P8C59_005063 [Phyllachora maydis]|uniref:Uncharacterized protein n=1 Tax=Phyllachora maydis TaxID=1825666 RepID=A0AAD9ME49_9PEZI|nr:hypothetical protein P8C59_005063 [Phyllachora maydis]